MPNYLIHTLQDKGAKDLTIVANTTGGTPDMSIEHRISVVPTFKPELCSFSCGSVTSRPSRKASPKAEDKPASGKEPTAADDAILENTMRMMKELSKSCEQNGTKPELEIYEVGMLGNVPYLIDEGYLKTPVYLQFVMGFLGGIPPTPRCLSFLYETARETVGDFTWSALGVGRRQMAICTQAILLGSNCVRVGLEDSLTFPDGSLAKGNVELGKYNYQPVGGYFDIPSLPGIGQELSNYALRSAEIEKVT